MYKRKIESVLTKWKDTPNHKPLVIKGVRQCGKTCSVLDFARRNYKNVVYMADTGLFISMLDEGTQADILQGKLQSFKGAIYENVLVDILGKMGRKLYYYQKPDSLEVDFIIRYKGECTPLECKAKTGNTKSLKTLLSHPEKYHVLHALKVGDYNVGRSDQVLTLPFYMSFLLTEL